MLRYNPLLQSLSELAETRPDFVIMHTKNRKLTAGELLIRSRAVASGLAGRGFKKNDTAVIAAAPGVEFLEIMNAVIMLQGKIAIIDPEMGRANYKAKMQQLQPGWMFADSRLLFLREHGIIKKLLLKLGKNLPEIHFNPGVRLIAVGRRLPIFRKHIAYPELSNHSAQLLNITQDSGESENIIIYTSGTLSVPKGVLHTGKSLGASINALSELLTKNRGAIVGASLPHFMLLGISSGLPVKMKRDKMSGYDFFNWLEQEQIGILFGPPSDYLPCIRYCEKEGKIFPLFLQHILIGSAPVHIGFLKRLIAVLPGHVQITCMYGMTENLLVATICGREKADYQGQGDLLGKPVPGVSVRIAGDGEIMVRSNQQFSRYFHEAGRSEWHATGDLGELDQQGNLILRGRKKEMIIRRNTNIYPALYENTIKLIRGVEEAAMVGIYDEVLQDEKVYLAIEGSNLDVRQIEKQLNQGRYSIDREALPDFIFNMVIPRKGRQHKIDRLSIVDHIKKNVL